MAASFTVSGTDLAFGNNKSLLTIFNGVSSAVILRIYRILILNNQTVAVANGVVTTLEIRRISASSGGSNLTVLKHDTNTSDLDANVTATTGSTDTVGTDIIKMFLWSTDEPAATTATIDEWQLLPVFNMVWDSGYADTNLEPIVLRAGEGLTIKQPGSNTLGQCDIFVEFTSAGS